jgi:hypothetical protein
VLPATRRAAASRAPGPVSKQESKYSARVEDVDGDERPDLVLAFSVSQLVANGDLTAASTSLAIRGFQGPGRGACVNFRGSDAVRVVS